MVSTRFVLLASCALVVAAATELACGAVPAHPGVVVDDVPPSDAGGGDATTGTSDRPDAAVDAPSSSTWCGTQPVHAFCDDFDTPGFRYGWDLGMPDGGSLQSAAATSPPNAFSSKTPALDAGESALADLHARVLPRNGATSYSFDVRIGSLTFPAPAAASGVTLARIERLDINFNTHEVLDLVARPAANGFRLVLQEGAIDGGGGFSVVAAHPLTTPLAVGTWVRVTVSASPWDPGKQTATAQIGAAPGETFSLVQSLPIGLGAFIVLGVRATGPAGAAEVSYDNVTYDDVP